MGLGIVFRRWSRAGYAAFSSLGKQVSVGRLCVDMLGGGSEQKGGFSVSVLRDRVLGGGGITEDEACWLLESANSEELYAAAQSITECCASRQFDTCSIINAKSGLCSEDCRWCAQSGHYSTGVDVYPLVGLERCVMEAVYNWERGVGSFSLVSSGRRASTAEVEGICERVRAIMTSECGFESKKSLKLCASLGLLDSVSLGRLRDAGVERYHCNLESAPSYFGELCSTHTVEDKLATLKSAREQGLKVCSGGIIGMGESAGQRVELAFKLKEVEGLDSIPLNILQPIVGTPLGGVTQISEDEVLRTIAMFRFVHPTAYLRFAGGRSQLSDSAQIKAMRIGINSAIVGDLLTTTGSSIREDFQKIKEAGYEV